MVQLPGEDEETHVDPRVHASCLGEGEHDGAARPELGHRRRAQEKVDGVRAVGDAHAPELDVAVEPPLEGDRLAQRRALREGALDVDPGPVMVAQLALDLDGSVCKC